MFIVITVITIFLLISLILWYQERERRIDFEERINTLESKNKELYTDKLKFQLQPHTLKNILAHLQIFANKLKIGMESLSDTLDYILYKNNNLVSVEDEIEFIKQYLKLNDLFINEIDSVNLDDNKINKSSKYLKKPCIPHLITAHFIENAFKHGDLNHPDFLKISIELTANTFRFTVINRINKITNSAKKGIGLSNMKERLVLLESINHEIKQSCNEDEYQSILVIKFIE